MKLKLTFQERAKLAMEALGKHQPVTLNQARAQALWLKKGRDINIPKEVFEQLLELDCKLKDEKDSLLIETLQVEKSKIFKMYPALEKLYYGKFKPIFDKYNGTYIEQMLPPPDPKLVAAFEKEVEDLVQEYKTLDLVSILFQNMIGNNGALQTVKRLINVQRTTKGFIYYPEKTPPDCMIESLVLKDQYKSLFTDYEINYCRDLIGSNRLTNDISG